jgi:hypothetical protein
LKYEWTGSSDIICEVDDDDDDDDDDDRDHAAGNECIYADMWALFLSFGTKLGLGSSCLPDCIHPEKVL